ncbi:McrB family protein [Flavobacterium sp. HJSW_4]|uniref:McrB family protein n=1 Tax=Flavobacterium sp. HJSW_4 TaxID=3344660 RepID=UPI0035F2632E
MHTITKQNIIEAIQEIEKNGIPSHRQSTTYDLIYNNKRYPPKLVISIANRFATGVELDPNTFEGGLDTPAFQKLENEGFEIGSKSKKPSYKSFKSIISPLKTYLSQSSSIVQNFKVGEHKPKSKWLFISDAVGIIGDYKCHYEIIERTNVQYSKKVVSVEIHFEDKLKKTYFSKLKDNLPELTYWNKDHQPGLSIAFKNSVNYDDENFFEKIEEALLYFEENLSDKIRKLITSKYSIAEMEIKFKNYLDKVIPKSATSYFSAIPAVTKVALKRKLLEENVYELQNLYILDKFLEDLNIDKEYLKMDRTGHSRYSSALKKYRSLLNTLGNSHNIFSQNNMSLNQIFYGPPGTGKTYNTINRSLELIGESIGDKTRIEVKELFEKKIAEGQIVFTTFHQNMSYEDFIEGIKPTTVDNKVNYIIEKGIFRTLCERAIQKKTSTNFDESYSKFVEEVTANGSILLKTPAQSKNFKVVINTNETAVAIPETEKGTKMGVTKEMCRDYIINGYIRDWKPYTIAIGEYIKEKFPVEIQDTDNDSKNFILIIDEINRGNVSKIFGELITLIEESKRLGEPEAITAVLPYSKSEFCIPKNVYILGTMNTADRSIEALDTALRRRFEFIEMPPKYDLFKEDTIENYRIGEFYAFDILKKINERIEVLLGRDHLIGHSFFLLQEEEDIKKKLVTAFYKNIIPLLQEYFYGDYDKIGLVLGNGFVIKEKVINHKELFANSEVFNGTNYISPDSYNFNIIEYSNDATFYKALEILMNIRNSSTNYE